MRCAINDLDRYYAYVQLGFCIMRNIRRFLSEHAGRYSANRARKRFAGNDILSDMS
jgi:hypothetical protein